MARKIIGNLYRIKGHNGGHHFVECDSFDDLCRYIAGLQKRGYLVSTVSRIELNGSTPKVAVLTSFEYKRYMKEVK